MLSQLEYQHTNSFARLVTGVAHVQMVLDPQVVQACLRELEAPVPELPALTR